MIYNVLEMLLELLRPVNGCEPFSAQMRRAYVVHVAGVAKQEVEV